MKMPTVSKILSDANSIRSREDRIKFLRSHKPNRAMLTLLKFAFDDTEFLLPEGTPPYKPSEIDVDNTMLYREIRRLYLFFDKNLKISNMKRELFFVQMLETIDPKDAELLIAVVNKKLPYKGITKKLVLEAFPGLFENGNNDEQDT